MESICESVFMAFYEGGQHPAMVAESLLSIVMFIIIYCMNINTVLITNFLVLHAFHKGFILKMERVKI